MAESIERLHAIFHGQVQGVGFRYTTRTLASAYHEVTGIVRNLPDGSVELIAEGSRTDLDRLLTDISAELDNYITNIRKQYIASGRAYSGFRIIL